MKLRPLAWFAFIALLGLGLALLLRASSTRDSAVAAPRVKQPAVAERDAPDPLAPPELPAPDADEPVPPVEPAATRTSVARIEPPTETLPSRPPLRISGSVVLVEADGTERRDVGGHFTFVMWQGKRGRHESVTVSAGRWSVELEPTEEGYSSSSVGYDADVGSARIQPAKPELDTEGGPVFVADQEVRYAFGDEDVELVFHRVPSIVLHVEDSGSGVPLTEVRLLQTDEWSLDDDGHPGLEGDFQVLATGRSPLVLTPSSKEATRGVRGVLVGCAGYAWERIEIDFGAGGERRLRLDPGGDLEVGLVGGDVPRGARLNLWRDGFRPFAQVTLEGENPILLRDLAPGACEARVEVGDWWSDPIRLAETPIEITAGETTRILLRLSAPPELMLAPLAGTVVLPREWEVDRPQLQAKFLDTPLDGENAYRYQNNLLRAPGAEDTFLWDLGDVQTGRYHLVVSQVEYAVAIDLGPEGATDVELVVPPPVTLRVFPRDTRTGEPAELERLLWCCKRPEGSRSFGFERVDREPGTDAFEFRVPRMEIELFVSPGRYLSQNLTVDARAEENVVTLEVSPASAIVVRLRASDTPVPWPSQTWPVETDLEGPGTMRSRGHRDGGLWFTLSEPGPYRFQPPTIDGFEPPDPVTFDAVEGETVEVFVDLVPIR